MLDAPGGVNDEYRLLTEIDRARQAQEITEHPLFVEAMEKYKTRLMDEWAASPARDKEGREHLWLMVKTVSVVEGHLKELMQTGKLATIQLEQRKSLMQRAKDWSGL